MIPPTSSFLVVKPRHAPTDKLLFNVTPRSVGSKYAAFCKVLKDRVARYIGKDGGEERMAVCGFQPVLQPVQIKLVCFRVRRSDVF